MTAVEDKAAESLVSCLDSQGVELRANLVRLTRLQVVFEVCGPVCVLRMSEVLQDFKILIDGRTVYFGRAVVSNLIDMGGVLICEAALQESWVEKEIFPLAPGGKALQAGFKNFMEQWQKTYKVSPEFKVVVADMQSFMADLKLWLEQVEVGLRSLPPDERQQAERDVVRELQESTTPAFSFLFEKFETICRGIDPELEPVHSAFCRRHLHPLLLASPFMHRIFVKPLGYAGDYEMVNMILRDSCEGGSLFAKLLNVFILAQVPAVAHRNRVTYLTRKLLEETNRCHQEGRTAKIFNFGCGPAKEVQDFLTHHSLSDHAQFDLLDFDDQALAFSDRVINEIRVKNRRRTVIKSVKKSVQQVLRQIGKPAQEARDYDFVYCAGLFDYLNNRTCKSLVSHFYDMLAPGGLLVVTNVESQHPIRNIMEYIYEWRLIYRNGKDLALLAPDQAPVDSVSVQMEASAGNIFLEVRKPQTTP